jgi:hypothetical protein
LSADTTSLESLNTFGWLFGLIEPSTASRLVVPICTPTFAPASADRVANCEALRATTACGAV